MSPEEELPDCQETAEDEAPEGVNVTLEVQSARHVGVSRVKP